MQMQVSVPVGAFPFTYKYRLTGRDGKQQEQVGEARTVSLPAGSQNFPSDSFIREGRVQC